MLHQKNNATKYDRYPEIFSFVSKIKGGNHNFENRGLQPKVLSFGCSFGDEISTLKDLYFKSAVIDGVDINHDCVSHCRNKFGFDNKIYSYEDFLNSERKYDVIFAMSVFCKWEDTEFIDDCTSVYPFKMFDDGVKLLYDRLKEGGLLVVYNSNFRMCDSSIYSLFETVSNDTIKESGFVHKFYKDNKKIKNDIEKNYLDVIFRKKVIG